MRFSARLTLLLLLAVAAFGQRRGGYSAPGRGFGGGFARGGFARGGFSHRGFVHGGFGFPAHRSFFSPFGYSSFGFWPYAYPAFVGGYWDGGYPYDYSYPYGYAGSNVQFVTAYSPPPPPVASAPVVIEQHIQTAVPRSVIQEYPPPAASKPEPKAETRRSLFLIAFKNSVIYAAEAYWVDGPTLHFVTLQHDVREAPLSKVDRDLSEQLNRERGVTLHLRQ